MATASSRFKDLTNHLVKLNQFMSENNTVSNANIVLIFPQME